MPVSDQWKAREKEVGGQVEKTSQSEVKRSGQTDGQGSSTAEGGGGPLSPGRTKGLAGFWANQNDEVKVTRKKRLEAVEAPATETVVENVPQRLDGVVRAEDPGEWKKPVEMETGRTRNVVSSIQQQHNAPTSPTRRDNPTDNTSVIRREKRPAPDIVPAKKPTQSPDAVLNRSSATVVLAENDPHELNPDVVRSSGGSSWDDVTELETGRTRNLLQHWKSTEEDAAQPKTSTTRYQGGAKPAWILEIEEARATSTGAIGQSEAWPSKSRQQEPQQQEDREIEEDEEEQKVTEEAIVWKDEAEIDRHQAASEETTATAPLCENLIEAEVTSQAPDIADSDVITPHLDTVHDLCDVSTVSPSESEHVTVTRDPEYEKTPPEDVLTDHPGVGVSPAVPDVDDDKLESAMADVKGAGDFEICDKVELPTDDVITRQQPITVAQDTSSGVSEPRPHEQPVPAASPSSSASSSTATEAVARQHTTQPISRPTTSKPVDTADDGRGKKRHKDDKTKANEQSTEHRHHRRWCSLM